MSFHWTNEAWYTWRESNPQDPLFESGMSASSITRARWWQRLTRSPPLLVVRERWSESNGRRDAYETSWGAITRSTAWSQRSGSNRPRTPYEGGMAPCHLAAVVNARGVDPRFALAREPSSGRRPGLRSWSHTWESNPVVSPVSAERLSRLARVRWYFGQESNLRLHGVGVMLIPSATEAW